ncbi:MAG: P-type conjugative transfer protein TrbG [Sphingobium sp.]|jgi:type IV secretion system protein VirB9
MIRPTRALRTSIMLSAVTLICIPAQAMAREQRAQPHPIPATSAQTLEPADPRTRVGRANAAARVEPERTSYFNAIQQYAYTDGALFQIYTAPGQITDIMLQEGEELVGPGPVASGDTVRWIIGDTVSGAGAARRVHILVKPTRADIRTNLIINTNRRTYHLELSATNSTYMAAVSWTYPQDALIALRTAEAERERMAPVASGIDFSSLNFRYRIGGDHPVWRPVRVFDDGRQVFIEFPGDIASGDMPPLFVIGADQAAELVNYRVQGRYMVVDRLFERAELRLGAGNSAKQVRIERERARRRSRS